MKIAFVDVLGLPYDGDTLQKRGLGGSESAVIYMSEELTRLGFQVSVFHECEHDDCAPGNYAGVQHVPLSHLEHDACDFDIVISSRSVEPFLPTHLHDASWCKTAPQLYTQLQKVPHKVLWLHDTFCHGDHLVEQLVTQNMIQELFVLSDWHMTYVLNCDHGSRRNYEVLKNRTWCTRNGVKNWIPYVDVSAKDPNQFVYNASVSKGMQPLLEVIWPQIKQHIPEATLKVIGGYYRFRSDQPPDEQEQNWHRLKRDHDKKLGVEFTGIIPQQQVAEILAKSSLMLYPAVFPETFGISSLESITYHTPIVTCTFGALEETALDMACYKMPYAVAPNSLFTQIDSAKQMQQFVQLTLQAHANKYLLQQKQHYCGIVKPYTSWHLVALQWKQHFYRIKDLMLSVEEFKKISSCRQRLRQIFQSRTVNPEDCGVYQPPLQPILFVTPFWNAAAYVSRCIMSVATQCYDNWRMIVIDDASTDNSLHMVQETVKSCPPHVQDKIQVWQMKQQQGAVANQYAALTWAKTNCDPETIVCLLDGDDWLVNKNDVLQLVNQHFEPHVEFSYGSCWSLADQIPLVAQEYPPHIKQRKAYRTHAFNWILPYTHLRAFRLKLFQEDLKHVWQDEQGAWFTAGGDVAVFYSLIERANPDGVQVMRDIIVNYNDVNPLNDYKVNATLQNQNAHKQTHLTKNLIVPATSQIQTPLHVPHVAHKNKILIAIPTAKYIESDTFKSVYDLTCPPNTELHFQTFYGYNVEQVRNIQVNYMLQNQFAWMLHVDSDVILPPHTLQRLLHIQSQSAAISSGVYLQRKEHAKIPEVYVQDVASQSHRNMTHAELFPARVQQVEAVGFGACLVRRDVYEKVTYPWFEYKSHIQFDQVVSEDVIFCMKAKQQGYEVVVDTGLHVEHIHKTKLII